MMFEESFSEFGIFITLYGCREEARCSPPFVLSRRVPSNDAQDAVDQCEWMQQPTRGKFPRTCGFSCHRRWRGRHVPRHGCSQRCGRFKHFRTLKLLSIKTSRHPVWRCSQGWWGNLCEHYTEANTSTTTRVSRRLGMGLANAENAGSVCSSGEMLPRPKPLNP